MKETKKVNTTLDSLQELENKLKNLKGNLKNLKERAKNIYDIKE